MSSKKLEARSAAEPQHHADVGTIDDELRTTLEALGGTCTDPTSLTRSQSALLDVTERLQRRSRFVVQNGRGTRTREFRLEYLEKRASSGCFEAWSGSAGNLSRVSSRHSLGTRDEKHEIIEPVSLAIES